MATAAPQVSGLQGMFECPVCLDDFKDPRVLTCAHHFCRVCLESIAGVNNSLICPTCRHDTQLGPGKHVDDLPRPVLVNELQRQISILLEGVDMKSTRYCDPCGRKNVTAVSHCNQCKKNFCCDCAANHKKPKMFENHETEPISKCVFCESHPDDIVTVFCQECKQCLCVNCIMGDHSDHKIEGIQVLADASRLRLEQFISEGDLTLNKAEVKEINKQISKAEHLKQQFQDSVSNLRDLLKEFEQKLDSLERSTEIKLSAEINNMKIYVSNLNEQISSKARLLDYAKHLLEKSPEPELVLKECEFPTSPDATSEVTPYTTNLPDFKEKFSSLCAGMKDLIGGCEDITYQSQVFDVSPLAPVIKRCSFYVGSDIRGLAINTKEQNLLVRTNDKSSPILVYDYNGQLLERLGGSIDGLVDRQSRAISLDTKRSMYLCPVEGALMLINTAGELAAKVKIGRDPYDISYSEEDDIYVISVCGKNKVYLVDAARLRVVRKFVGGDSGDRQATCPFKVHVGHVTDINQPVIVVSDFGNHSVKVHDIRGRHIRTFGRLGSGDGHLLHPRGVTTDPAGRIIVCDRDHCRIVSFWSENAQNKWRCLLDRKQLKGDPWCVSCDPQMRVLAVGFDSGLIQVFQ